MNWSRRHPSCSKVLVGLAGIGASECVATVAAVLEPARGWKVKQDSLPRGKPLLRFFPFPNLELLAPPPSDDYGRTGYLAHTVGVEDDLYSNCPAHSVSRQMQSLCSGNLPGCR
jgi:hypothetical protein